MKWVAAKVYYELHPACDAGDVIADIFHETGIQGVVIEEPGIDPEEGWGDDAVKPAGHHAVTGYFPDTDSIKEQRRRLERALAGVSASSGINYSVEYAEVRDEDWAESWKVHFNPEKIGRWIVVKPTWKDYFPADGEIVVEIDPGMAFGTGAHPTTALCINLMETHLRPGMTFLDVGTGSGILSIVAAKLGAGRLCGIDTDEVALDVARKNLLLNGVGLQTCLTARGSLIEAIGRPFDLVVANILSEKIIELVDQDVKRAIKPGGLFISSGIIVKNREKVIAKLVSNGFSVLETLEKEGWVAIAASPSAS